MIAALITAALIDSSQIAGAQDQLGDVPAPGATPRSSGAAPAASHAPPPTNDWIGSGESARRARHTAIQAIPMSRLTPAAQQRITAITNRPTLYRHLSEQTIQCDPDLFLFVVRHPEVLVGIWDLMEITQVQTERVGDFQLRAVDGSGTDCTVDLVYGDSSIHVYIADGFYDGTLTASPINGRGVFVLRCRHRTDAAGSPVVDGTLDCFIQVDHLAADLLIRTFGPLIGRTADNNFAETAKFINQLGTSARNNPSGMEELAMRLPQVSAATRARFAAVVRQTAARHHGRQESLGSSRTDDRRAEIRLARPSSDSSSVPRSAAR